MPSNTATPTGQAGTQPGSTAAPDYGNGGEVTIRMAEVGQPGNPLVGVVQTFGLQQGAAARLPEGAGIYPTCAQAPTTAPAWWIAW